jgi:hypothetical protein
MTVSRIPHGQLAAVLTRKPTRGLDMKSPISFAVPQRLHVPAVPIGESDKRLDLVGGQFAAAPFAPTALPDQNGADLAVGVDP